MELCHPHNLSSNVEAERPFGIRVRLDSADSLRQLLGDFEKVHWFESEAERDRALAEMAGEHLYSRHGDKPALRFDPVEKR